jgi:ATP-dependent Clp protease adaptor protein ClpS
MAPGKHPRAIIRFFMGISSACAMSQRILSLDPTPIDASFRPLMGNDEHRPTGPSGPATSVITKVKPKTKRPNLYRVLILNDDYTPMEFVVHVLEKFFQKDVESATKIMLHVHHHGIGECGVFTYEIAETKVTQVMDFARKHQHPLQCVMEKK